MNEVGSARELSQLAAGIDPANCQASCKVAILGQRSTQFLSKFIQQAGLVQGIRIELYEAAYDQIEQEILDEHSGLYSMNPEVVFMVHSLRKLRKKFYQADLSEKKAFFDSFLRDTKQLCERIRSQSGAKIILTNLEDLPDGLFGNYANKTRASFSNHIRRINTGLMDQVESTPDVHILDVARLQSLMGVDRFLDPVMEIHADVPFSLNAEAQVAMALVRLLQLVQGRFAKCVIMDLDNTIWGGVAGDDGLEGIVLGGMGMGKAYADLQSWLLQLKKRGILLAVCSKNEEQIAKEIFTRHEEMILQLSDIAVFLANWNNKADNICQIQQELQIGFDSMVFLDDNPVERAFVRSRLPEVWVPELPEDPAKVLPYLRRLNLFETSSFSDQDLSRTRQYQTAAQRKTQEGRFENADAFLQSLEMKGEIQAFQPKHIARIAQLSQRSNQFNLRTIRYTESEVERRIILPQYLTYEIHLADRYGSYGLISLIVGKQTDGESLWIENWIMSCRVIKRGVEQFVLNHLIRDVQTRGIRVLQGEYIPTPKNQLVKHHYQDLGFSQREDGIWELEFSSALPLPHFIAYKSSIG